ncbi:MAG TPA: polyprenyl synthetase family protein [Gemmatimonadales bacterium]|nr:polyprenyl synthetase family protein [Gemmatimonadales bacterium]
MSATADDRRTIDAFLARAREATDRALERALADILPAAQPALGDAVRYAVMGSGKRFRPALMLGAYESEGGRESAILDLAAAVEIVHAYSLVHDDLPCMDNDDLRRGRPTVHRAFDVARATVAGFAMVPVAAAAVARGARLLRLPAAEAREIELLLFRAAGGGGMIGGQVLDLEAPGQEPSRETMTAIDERKTGALIAASVEIGAVAARAPARVRAAYRAYGRDVGLAFQIADDILDVTATSAELGKTPGKDAKLGKPTFPMVFGIPGAQQEAERLAERAVAHLAEAGVSSPLLAALARYVVARRS